MGCVDSCAAWFASNLQIYRYRSGIISVCNWGGCVAVATRAAQKK